MSKEKIQLKVLMFLLIFKWRRGQCRCSPLHPSSSPRSSPPPSAPPPSLPSFLLLLLHLLPCESSLILLLWLEVREAGNHCWEPPPCYLTPSRSPNHVPIWNNNGIHYKDHWLHKYTNAHTIHKSGVSGRSFLAPGNGNSKITFPFYINTNTKCLEDPTYAIFLKNLIHTFGPSLDTLKSKQTQIVRRIKSNLSI